MIGVPSALGLLLTLAACASTAAGRGAPSLIAGDVIVFDDFTGPALDRTKWTVEVRGTTVNDELQAYIDSPETIAIVHGDHAAGASNGALELRPRWRPGFPATDSTRLDFVSGQVNTRDKFTFAHGTAAARMKLPS